MKVVVVEEKEEVEFLGTDKDNHRCLFYDSRTCHVREQLEITDEDLREDKVTIQRDQVRRPHQVREPLENEEIEYDTYRTLRNVSDWLVNNFCRICPHL